MNTIFKRVISGAAALGIAVSGLAIGVSTAYAADPTTGSITINKSDTGQVDHSFDGWHLASLTNVTKDSTNKINGFLIDTDDNMVRTIVAAMTSDQKVAYEKDANYYSTDNAVANPMGYLVEKVFKDKSGKALSELTSPWGGDSSTLRVFAKSLSKELAKAGAPTADKTGDSALKTGENKELKQGLWFLKDVTTTDDTKGTNSIPIITPTTFDGAGSWGTVTLKNTTPTIDKKLVDSKGDGTYTPNTQPDYAVGDDVYYELTSTVPVYTGYDIDSTMMDATKTRIFKINDTASKALTVSADTVIESVKLTPAQGTAVTLVKDKDYTVTVAGYGDVNTPDTDAYKGGHVTTIDLGKYVNKAEGSKSATDGILEGATVTVIVKAKLNKDALISKPGNLQKNPNKVDLEYSNHPEEVNHAHKVPGPEVPVYAYKFDILKTDKAGTTKLPGAKFTIKAVSGTSKHDGKYLGSYGKDGWSYLDSEPAVADTDGVFTTGTDGKINVSGLDAGTYEVHEIAPPDGYTAISLPKFQFTITPTVGDEAAGCKTITVVALSLAKGADERASLSQDGKTLNIWNAKNITELPKTGGVGLAMIVAVGALFIAASGIFALRARRKA
ncbi:fimbrial isopeptide formation D2 domain-containing protein [Bifidobacterium breve]|uniref:SpaA isopeptide-forming pilin-related protein n=1 Tax=Bifidobacterium TaxID=1678 RepID=UPI0009BB5890|nr:MULTISPECIES: SpaA isopeptide-forming pilin-related protein [Bifidobacterium]OQM49421.1 fimbrial isopeptide formation D2 domain-containing protein [Bifidobacterium breve]TCE34241.1 Cell surface protein [Bifidobacterium longum subsp. longum]TCF74340.1 Cell surface protein [Bifidobacterium longum subsp. longum]